MIDITVELLGGFESYASDAVLSLNVDPALIAAANPAWGRYNPQRTAAENINLPPALLSRFDLLFVIRDIVQSANDER
ncbi:hypothetical protein KIPB_005564 [Kipferlia bialata]|uniref:MCM C-terminal AAA(+) ATPase domain-containing protein n=1 Tax=Kipferlia bialata TaxID=797122 RepID=A0A9K3CW75_9EUKA|nr:hypothetical protein KIPB_005564 [Kipferlia bialata]|eukprot:g5564.t1